MSIHGTDFYTNVSSICIATIPRGVLNDLGGEVKFMITIIKVVMDLE